ncbi:MAG: hypothetical protein ACRBCI_08080 [Cellvibrionaceae bacterium]
MKSVDRRRFLRNSLFATLSLSARAAIIGVPTSFLVSGKVHSQTAQINPKFTILAQSGQGESFACNGPGSFPVNGNDPAQLIAHPNTGELGNAVLGNIQGREFTARDFMESADIRLGEQTVKASRVWSGLPQGFLNNLTGFWHQTGTNAHPEFPAVRRLMGALRDDVIRNNEEELASAIANDIGAGVGATTSKPILLDGGGTFKGAPLAVFRPSNIKQLFGGDSRINVNPDQFSALYTQTMDALYQNLKQNGTRAQRTFLDQHALSRNEAVAIGDDLGGLLASVDGDDFESQLKTAVALFRLKVTPVVCVRHEFSRDNHQDTTLEDEATRTLASLNALANYWNTLVDNGLSDQVNFATLDVFGRTPHRSTRNGGRDHFNQMTLGLAHGSDFKGGMIGGLQAIMQRGNERPVATGINSQTGGSNNADIPSGSTLAAYGKTLMKAAGIDDERLEVRVPSGKVITGSFT